MPHNPFPFHRFYPALRPPLDIAHEIIEKYAHYCRSPLRPEYLHLTLDIIGDFEQFPQSVAEELAGMGPIQSSPFWMVVDKIAANNRCVVLRPQKSIALQALSRELRSLRAQAGLPQRTGFRFSPHITVGYGPLEAFTKSIEPIAWRVDKVVLVHSLAGKTQQTELQQWPLL